MTTKTRSSAGLLREATPRSSTRHAPRGFTLMELMLSMALAAILMVALIDSFQTFGHQLDELRSAEVDLQAEDCLVQIAQDIRHAWLVEEPVADELSIMDAYGGVTAYALSSTDLEVTRPSGVSGTMLEDVQDFGVETATMQRLRPDTPLDSYDTWWEDSSVVGGARPILVEEDLPLALGFTLDSAAPDSYDTVTGVDELVLEAELARLLVPLTFSWPVEEDVLGSGGSNPDDGPGNSGNHQNAGNPAPAGKAKIGHMPPGSPNNCQTIVVDESSLTAHVGHGDVLGGCGPVTPLPNPDASNLIIELYEARAPQDARPYESPLGTITVPVTALPGGSYAWRNRNSQGPGLTVICHLPPQSGWDMRTMAVPDAEVADHLGHGDVLGSCVDGSSQPNTPVCVYTVPVANTPLDLSSMAAIIEPGRSYTLVLRIVGRGTLLFSGVPLASDVFTGIAHQTWSGGNFVHKAYAINRVLDGTVSYTQTLEHDVVSRVSLQLDTTDGETLTSSAAVLSQVGVQNPWLGAVPGSLPALELAGQ